MKGIILAGGVGSRLYPLTIVTNKHLLPVYNKPMIYYPLSTLMLAGIKDILIISTPNELLRFQNLLGTGERFGINLSYAAQPTPDGIAQAFLIAENFISNSSCALILGDNIFYGTGLNLQLHNIISENKGATILAYLVDNPERYGVIEFNERMEPMNILEKPKHPKSHYAVTGLYFYDSNVCDYVKKLKPSLRNELEITDLNRIYLEHKLLNVKILDRENTWIDVGTQSSLLDASNFIHLIEEQQNIIVASPEVIAYRKKWIDKESLLSCVDTNVNSEYVRYIDYIANEAISKNDYY